SNRGDRALVPSSSLHRKRTPTWKQYLDLETASRKVVRSPVLLCRGAHRYQIWLTPADARVGSRGAPSSISCSRPDSGELPLWSLLCPAYGRPPAATRSLCRGRLHRRLPGTFEWPS